MATATINARHRKNFKAGGRTAPGCNIFRDSGYRLTRSARAELVQSQRLETKRITGLRAARQQERRSPLPRPTFLRRCVNFLKGVA